MSAEQVTIEHGRHEPGEYFFTPGELTLSAYFGPPLAIEQVADRPWEGIVLRGDLKVMVPSQTRVFRHREAAEFVVLTLHDACFEELPSPARHRPRPCLRDPAVIDLVRALVHGVATGTSSRLFRDAAALAIAARLADLERLSPEATGAVGRRLSGRALARVLEYMRAHLTEEVSMQDLARIAGMSPSYFSTMFRNAVGEPPHRHHVRMRVERARALLVSGASASVAAQEAGFCDQSHLARHMRRLLGTTPTSVGRRSGRS
jgi:AraC family transcriptional regulator